jgi:hypothetical protein
MRRLAWIGLLAAGVAGVSGCTASPPGTGSLSSGASASPSLTPVHLVSKCRPVASKSPATYELTLTNTPQNRDVVVTDVLVDFFRGANLLAHQEIPGGVIKPGQTITLGRFETTSISGRGWTCRMASYVGGERS